MRMAVLLAMLLSVSPAFAMSVEKSAAATSTGQMKASAVLEFRIVIPETLQLDPPPLPRRHANDFLSRTVSLEGGRSVVTVAKP